MLKKTSVALCVAACITTLGAGSALADESTSVGGRMYADFTNIQQKSDDVKTPATGTGIDVKRFYLIVDHKFDDIWSANLTTDFNYVGNDGETQVFIKKAYVQAKLSDAFVARAGSADTPWVPFVEGLYGYRFLENTLIDRLKFGTSADWGLNANGKLASGMANYSVSLLNGNGYKNPSRSKQVDVEGRIGFVPMEGLTLAAGFYSGKLGKDVEGGADTRTADRFDALAAYSKDGLRLGAEFFTAKNWNSVLISATEDKADGYSVWASYDFNPQWGAFVRGDWAKTSKDINPDLKDEYFNVGVVTHARKNVDVAFAYKHEKADNGFVSTSNGTIGGASDGKYDEVGVWAQVQF